MVKNLKTAYNKINEDVQKESEPRIDLRFLHHSNKCLASTFKIYKKDKSNYITFLEELQKFIYEFSTKETYSKAVKCFSSHKSGKKLEDQHLENQLLHDLPEDAKKAAKDELMHLHLKSNGKGESVVFGFGDDGVFYIIALDPKHELLPCK